MSKRRVHDAAFKARLAFEALKGKRMVSAPHNSADGADTTAEVASRRKCIV